VSRQRLFQLDFSGGANTKDPPRSLAKNQAQELVNLYPGDEPRPREGCTLWHPDDLGVEIGEVIPFAHTSGNKVIVFTPNGFAWMQRGKSPKYIGSIAKPAAGTQGTLDFWGDGSAIVPTRIMPDGKEWTTVGIPGGMIWWNGASTDDGDGRYSEWSYLAILANIMPAGWRVPSYADAIALISSVDGSAATLKATSGWNTSPGVDSWGFALRGTGLRQTGTFPPTWMGKGTFGAFWLSDIDSNGNYQTLGSSDGDPTFSITPSAPTAHEYYPIRLVRDVSWTAMPNGLRWGAKLSWSRVEGAVIVGSDCGWSGIFEWDDKAHEFTLRNANIELPPSAYLSVAPSDYSGSLDEGKWYSYAWTLVNRGQDVGVNKWDGFVPGKLESWENLDKRVTVHLPEGKTSTRLQFHGIPVGVDPQATHIRVYRTMGQDSEEIAAGYTHGWLADIAIVPGQTVSVYDHVAGVETDQAPTTSGMNEMPALKSMVYANGRLWINGAFGGSPGRWWYSSGIQNAVGYLKHLTMFNLSTDFKDCSLDDAQQATGAMLLQGDLYLFNERSIFRIADADPSNNPKAVSTKVGCPFPRTLTTCDTWGMFLSEYGPRMIQGGAIDPVKAFTSGQVWPNSVEPSSILRSSSEEVVGFWYRSTWWIASGGTIVGLFSDESRGDKGVLSIEFADPSLSMRRIVVFSESEAVFPCGGRLIWFLRDNAKTDLDYWITARIKTRRLYVDITDPGKKGEPWDVRVGASFTDPGNMKIRLVGDADRFRKQFVYQTRPKSSLLQPQDVSAAVVTTYQQAVPAGLHASWFEVTVEKMLRAPFDFRLTGIELGYIPRKSRPQDDVSLSIGSDDPIDSGLALVDVTEVLA